MYTSHGHHIPGTPKDENPPKYRARCSAFIGCPVCQREAAQAKEADED